MAGKKCKYMVLIDDYMNVERIFAPFMIILAVILIILSINQILIPLDKLVIGISVLIVAILMFLEGILKKVLVIVRIGLSPAVYIIFGLFLVFESVRRITQNFTVYTFQNIDFVLFLTIFTLGIHFLHVAGLMKFEDQD